MVPAVEWSGDQSLVSLNPFLNTRACSPKLWIQLWHSATTTAPAAGLSRELCRLESCTLPNEGCYQGSVKGRLALYAMCTAEPMISQRLSSFKLHLIYAMSDTFPTLPLSGLWMTCLNSSPVASEVTEEDYVGATDSATDGAAEQA